MCFTGAAGAAATLLLAGDTGWYSARRVALTPPGVSAGNVVNKRNQPTRWVQMISLLWHHWRPLQRRPSWPLLSSEARYSLPPSPPWTFFPLLEAATAPPRPPCSVSITGNNRPVVFHRRTWRRFPPRCHEVSAVPARQSAHLGDAAGGESWGWGESAPAPAFSFPYGSRRRDLTHGSASLISESDTGWTKGPSARRSHWKDFYKPHKAANWQGPH